MDDLVKKLDQLISAAGNNRLLELSQLINEGVDVNGAPS